MDSFKGLIYLIDLDGTIYRGSSPIQYAKEFIRYLQEKNRRFLLVTNCPGNSAEALAEKLGKMEIDVEPESIISSADAVADYLVNNTAYSEVYLIGSNALKDKLMKAGINIVAENPDCVVVGYDTEFNYAKMKDAVQFIQDGAGFVSTNVDFTIPDGDKLVPHTGAIAAGIEAATGVKPVIIGKPEHYLLDTVTRRLNCSRNQCCVIGDRLDTDICFGVKQSIPSFLVLTGVTSTEMLKNSKIQPTRVFSNLHDLMMFDEENNL